jgi:hypothetical protein
MSTFYFEYCERKYDREINSRTKSDIVSRVAQSV